MKPAAIYVLILTSFFTINSYSQQARWVTKKYKIVKDSVLVDHKAVFCKFKYYDQKEEEDAVRLTLTIKNNTNHIIPDIATARFSQPGGLNIYINGNNAMQMTLSNGVHGADHYLLKGDLDTWPMELQIAGPHAIDYGNIFTFQWEYMGIKSPIMQVDVKSRIITEVKEHLKDGKVVY
jgi:hypothetical protein